MSTHASDATTSESAPAIELSRSSERVVLWVLLLASFVVILNETIMAVALPALMTAFSVDAPTVQWVTTGFMLTMAIVIPTTGFLQERLTTRAVFLLAMTLFSAGTLMGALAPSFAWLLAARVVQACGTAVMMPLLMTTILVIIPMERRGQVMGTISVVMSLAPALGPTVSGFVLQFLSWRWLFWLVLPIALLMLGVGLAKMVTVNQTRVVPLDAVSVLLSALGFGGLVFGLSKVGETAPSGHELGYVALAVSGVSLAVFVWRQLALGRRDAAFLDLTCFKVRNFSLAIGVLMIAFAALIGVSLLWPIYLQNVRGVNTLTTGLLLLPGGLAMGVAGPFVGRLFDRFGARPLVVPAGAVVVAMVFLMGFAGPSTPLIGLLLLHLCLSAGLSFVFTPVFTGGLNDLPPHQYSHGSALLGTLQQVAGAAGTALLISVMANKQAADLARGVLQVAALNSGIRLALWVSASMALAIIVLGALMRNSAKPETHTTHL